MKSEVLGGKYGYWIVFKDNEEEVCIIKFKNLEVLRKVSEELIHLLKS